MSHPPERPHHIYWFFNMPLTGTPASTPLPLNGQSLPVPPDKPLFLNHGVKPFPTLPPTAIPNRHNIRSQTRLSYTRLRLEMQHMSSSFKAKANANQFTEHDFAMLSLMARLMRPEFN